MFAQAHFPSQPLSPEALDQYLLNGWFRMEQSIFTCTYLHLNNQVYRALWLRVVLDELDDSKTIQKLSKLNSKFTVKIQQASVTPEKEELFNSYKSGISFQPSASLDILLFNNTGLNIYNTLEITIYDGEKLIAVGFFDVGKNSAAGISSFYDPAYKKYSLGKFLIYQKMLYCKNQQINYFYLGYFAPGCKAFDYKLDIGKDSLEYFDLGSQQWNGMNSWDPVKGSIEENRQKLMVFQQALTSVNIENRLFRYSYFQANIFRELQGYDLFDYLLFVYCFQYDPDVVNPVVVYDLRDEKYYLLKCISVGKPEAVNNDMEEYTANVLKITEVVYSTRSPKDMAEVMARAIVKVGEEDGVNAAHSLDLES